MTGAIPIRDVKDILEACFTKEEWLKVKDQRQDEIINRLTRICEVMNDRAVDQFSAHLIDYLKRC